VATIHRIRVVLDLEFKPTGEEADTVGRALGNAVREFAESEHFTATPLESMGVAYMPLEKPAEPEEPDTNLPI